MPPNTKKCEEQFKTYKERADYLSDINPQNTQIYRAIAHFFGEDLIPCGTKELNEKIMNDGSHTPQNEKSDQPKPEVPKCESGCLKHKYHCAKCNAIITYSPANYASRPNDIPNPCPNDCGRIAPASTEEWDREKIAELFTYKLGRLVGNKEVNLKTLLYRIEDIVASHDQQLRQRIVEALGKMKKNTDPDSQYVTPDNGYDRAIEDAQDLITNLK